MATAATRPSPGAPTGVVGDGVAGATDLFRALASAHRVAIVVKLADAPRCVHELADHLGVSQALVSQHLRVLRASHLVRTERRGKEVTYSLGDSHVAHIVLDAVAHAAEQQSPTARRGASTP